jgi:hypothetical protein
MDPEYPHLDRIVRAGGATLLLVDAPTGTLAERQRRWLESVLTDVAASFFRGDRIGTVLLYTQNVPPRGESGSIRSVVDSLVDSGLFFRGGPTSGEESAASDRRSGIALFTSVKDRDPDSTGTGEGTGIDAGLGVDRTETVQGGGGVHTTAHGTVRLVALDADGGVSTTVQERDDRRG